MRLSLPFHDHSPDGNGRVTRYCPSASATRRLPWHGSALGSNWFVSAAETGQGNTSAGAANPPPPSTATTVLVSLYQENLVGIRCLRYLNWAKARASSVAYISGVTY